jgi:superoxide reductase
MKDKITFYRCSHCGNMVALIKKGGGTLVCCGDPMTKLDANLAEASHEKHIPAVTKQNGKLLVQVGSAPHPMTEEHFIEWIALVKDTSVEIKFLKAGDAPTAEFIADAGEVYAYCNIHGLWVTQI